MATMIGAFFDRYRRAFEAYDLDALVPLVHRPCLIVSGTELVAVAEQADLRERLARQFERHRELGVVDATFDVAAHRRLEPRYVTADVRWTFYKEEREPLTEFGVHYVLTAPESGWKIACVLPWNLSAAGH